MCWGGQVITDYDAQGARRNSYVYADSTLVYQQLQSQSLWHVSNPLAGDTRDTDSTGRLFDATYLDPQGVNTGPSDPANQQGDPVPAPMQGAGLYASLQAISLFDGGNCSMDGMGIGCAFVSNMRGTGATEECVGGSCLHLTIPGMGIPPGRVPIDFAPDFEDWLRMTKHGNFSEENIYDLGQEYYAANRSLSRSEVSSLIDDILKLFKDHPGCEEWTNKLLEEMKSSSGYSAGNIRDILDGFRKDGILITNGIQSGDGSGATGYGLGYLTVGFNKGGTTEQTAVTIMHEIIHWVGLRPGKSAEFYTDKAMADAWFKLGVVMSAEQYRTTFPKFVAETTARDRSDFVESRLAGAANKITCLGETPPVRTLP